MKKATLTAAAAVESQAMTATEGRGSQASRREHQPENLRHQKMAEADVDVLPHERESSRSSRRSAGAVRNIGVDPDQRRRVQHQNDADADGNFECRDDGEVIPPADVAFAAQRIAECPSRAWRMPVMTARK